MSASDDACDPDRSEPNAVLRVGEDISLDALFRALGDHRRRRLIRFFVDRPERSAGTEELVDHLVGRDSDCDERESAAVSLHHTHLPKLEAVGIVDHDRSSDVVTYRGVNRVEAILGLVADCEPEARSEAVGTQIGFDEFAE